MYFSRRDGVVSPSLWAQIERTMIDFLAYPGTRQWWETRKHCYTEEFACVVDEIIAKGSEPKAYATYDLRNLPSSLPSAAANGSAGSSNRCTFTKFAHAAINAGLI